MEKAQILRAGKGSLGKTAMIISCEILPKESNWMVYRHFLKSFFSIVDIDGVVVVNIFELDMYVYNQ